MAEHTPSEPPTKLFRTAVDVLEAAYARALRTYHASRRESSRAGVWFETVLIYVRKGESFERAMVLADLMLDEMRKRFGPREGN